MPRPMTIIQPVNRIETHQHGSNFITLAIYRTDDDDEAPLNLDLPIEQARELVKDLQFTITGEELCEDCAYA